MQCKENKTITVKYKEKKEQLLQSIMSGSKTIAQIKYNEKFI